MNRQRRNMTAGVLHGAFFQMATAFAEPFAVLPVFFKAFTTSNVLVGVAISLIQAGRVLPQLPIARLIRRRPGLSRPLMLAGIWTRFAGWGFIAALTLLTPGPGPTLAIGIVALLLVYSMAGGVANLPLNRVIEETIPPDRRSSFFGLRLFFGGILAILAGYLVKRVMGSTGLEWPTNYGVLFLLSFLTLGVAYTAMSRLQFPSSVAGLDNSTSLGTTDESGCQSALHSPKAGGLRNSVVGGERCGTTTNGLVRPRAISGRALSRRSRRRRRKPAGGERAGGQGVSPDVHSLSLLEEARSCFRAYPVLRRLVFVEILSGGITLLLPFLAIYGTEELGFALSWIGLFIIAQKAGAILGNLVWMPLGNRHGTRLVILLGLVSGLLGAVVVWTLQVPLGFTLAFALLGLAQSGAQVGFSGYILEIGHHEIRPLLIAIEQTLLIPLYFAPVLGGVLADQLGYASLAVAATLLLGVALFLAYRLCEPRNGDPRCKPCGPFEIAQATRQEP